jgi:hypothetical protein
MEDPDNNRRIAICGVNNQIRIAGQHHKPILGTRSEVPATPPCLGILADAFGRFENGVEQALRCDGIFAGDPFHRAVDVTARPP